MYEGYFALEVDEVEGNATIVLELQRR